MRHSWPNSPGDIRASHIFVPHFGHSGWDISGEPVAKLFPEINEGIKNGVDYIVQHRQDDQTIAAPSSVIKWDNGKITVIRP